MPTLCLVEVELASANTLDERAPSSGGDPLVFCRSVLGIAESRSSVVVRDLHARVLALTPSALAPPQGGVRRHLHQPSSDRSLINDLMSSADSSAPSATARRFETFSW